jgi:hypothetical protein
MKKHDEIMMIYNQLSDLAEGFDKKRMDEIFQEYKEKTSGTRSSDLVISTNSTTGGDLMISKNSNTGSSTY